MWFDAPAPAPIVAAITALDTRRWDHDAIRAHATRFAPERFRSTLQAVVDEACAAVTIT